MMVGLQFSRKPLLLKNEFPKYLRGPSKRRSNMATPATQNAQNVAVANGNAAAAEPKQPMFNLLPGGIEFSVFIPDAKTHHSWIVQHHGSFNQQTKEYSFMMSHLSQVEANLGLPPGGSTLRDPKHYFTITLKGDVYTDGSFNALVATMKEHGVTWNKHNNSFEGSLKDYAKVAGSLA